MKPRKWDISTVLWIPLIDEICTLRHQAEVAFVTGMEATVRDGIGQTYSMVDEQLKLLCDAMEDAACR